MYSAIFYHTQTHKYANTQTHKHTQHPQEPNGIITNYTLRYKLEGEISYTLVEMGSNNTEYELFPLLPKASYEIEVAGSTSVGLGPYSDALIIFTDKIGTVYM